MLLVLILSRVVSHTSSRDSWIHVIILDYAGASVRWTSEMCGKRCMGWNEPTVQTHNPCLVDGEHSILCVVLKQYVRLSFLQCKVFLRTSKNAYCKRVILSMKCRKWRQTLPGQYCFFECTATRRRWTDISIGTPVNNRSELRGASDAVYIWQHDWPYRGFRYNIAVKLVTRQSHGIFDNDHNKKRISLRTLKFFLCWI